MVTCYNYYNVIVTICYGAVFMGLRGNGVPGCPYIKFCPKLCKIWL
jgi:hypothetical protein